MSQTFIDLRLNLAWVIGSIITVLGCFFSLGVMVANTGNQIDKLIGHTSELNKQIARMESQFSEHQKDLAQSKLQTEKNELRIRQLETDFMTIKKGYLSYDSNSRNP